MSNTVITVITSVWSLRKTNEEKRTENDRASPFRSVQWMNFYKLIDLEFQTRRLRRSYLSHFMHLYLKDILGAHYTPVSLLYSILNHPKHQRKFFPIQNLHTRHPSGHIHTSSSANLNTFISAQPIISTPMLFDWKRRNFISSDNLPMFSAFNFPIYCLRSKRC